MKSQNKEEYGIIELASLFIFVIIAIIVMIFVLHTINQPPTTSSSSNNSVTYGTVIEVTDGDTVRVQYQETNEIETIRIYGIDTPEKSTRKSGTSEYGVSSTVNGVSCLESSANEATEFAEEQLLNEHVKIVKTNGSDRGDFGRQLRYIIPSDENKTYGESVISQGLARVYDDQGSFDKYDEYVKAETVAKTRQKGLWKCSENQSNIAIFEVRSDSEGDDTQGLTEFVEIGNLGNESVSLNNYELSDETDKSFNLSGYSIPSNETVQVHTCSAPEFIKNSIVWNRCTGIWNNGGDTVNIRYLDDILVKLKYT